METTRWGADEPSHSSTIVAVIVALLDFRKFEIIRFSMVGGRTVQIHNSGYLRECIISHIYRRA
jgi:hypothetical protein